MLGMIISIASLLVTIALVVLISKYTSLYNEAIKEQVRINDELIEAVKENKQKIQGIEERVEYHIASFSEKSNHNFEMIDTYQKNLIKELNLIQWEKQDLDSVEKLIEAVNARRGCEKLIVKEKRG